MENENGAVGQEMQAQAENTVENTSVDTVETNTETQNVSNNQNNSKILGKFKSIEDLAAAYKNMESQQGQQSKELGELRKKAELLDSLSNQIAERSKNAKAAQDYLSQVLPKYQKDEYFNNTEFNSLYTEAFRALGPNLDTDKFVSLLDKYVESRISMSEKAKAAKNENENAKSQMQFSSSDAKSSSKAVTKLDMLTPQQIDEYIAKHI